MGMVYALGMIKKGILCQATMPTSPYINGSIANLILLKTGFRGQ